MTQEELVLKSREQAGIAYVSYLLAVEENAPATKQNMEHATWQYVEARYLDELAILRAQEAAERTRAPRD